MGDIMKNKISFEEIYWFLLKALILFSFAGVVSAWCIIIFKGLKYILSLQL